MFVMISLNDYFILIDGIGLLGFWFFFTNSTILCKIPFSHHSCFADLDLHNPEHIRLATGSQIAAELREAMHDRLGLTGSAGLASNKLLAKLVSGTFKPNQQTVLLPESRQDLMASLGCISKVPGRKWGIPINPNLMCTYLCV